MDKSFLQYLAVGLLVVLAFVPITLNALKKRNVVPPPMAANDRKLYRLWRSDPDAYKRQYGELDRHYQQVDDSKSDSKKS